MKQLTFQNLDRVPAFEALQELPLAGDDTDAPPLTGAQIRECDVSYAAGVRYNWAARLPRNLLPPTIISLLSTLAAEQQCTAKYRALSAGEIFNPSEGRRVLHHLLRGELVGAVHAEGSDIGSAYRSQLSAITQFAHRVRSGSLRAPSGKRYRSVVQIGIGGSELGPRALYRALKNCRPEAPKESNECLEAHFISNVDADQARGVLGAVDIEATLFIVVSKSGTTTETGYNERFVAQRLRRAGVSDPSAQMVAVTACTSAMATRGGYAHRFFIDNHIGGRFSASGAVGGVVLSLCCGPEIFARVLEGAHAADHIALNSNPLENPPLLDALFGLYERNIRGWAAYAVLPYSDALEDLPSHIQQLDMESNGKSVNRHGQTLSYATGPLVFGGAGTNVQHSFYQLLHQGSTVVPMIFVGFSSPQSYPLLLQEERQAHTELHTLLNANLAAQMVAYRDGEVASDLNNSFAGGRPSSLLYGTRLTPEAVGALLSFFENRVMFQGFLWNINSFDQPGVELGKKLTGRLLRKEVGASDSALYQYAELLGIKRTQ